jgi:phosphate transport system ATP-binding protein
MQRFGLLRENGMVNNPKILAEHINAFFGKTQALKDVSLRIPAYRVVAIIGPSGCGKSTFLRCINRMHEVAGGTMEGTMKLDDMNIVDIDPVQLRRRVGMVFQKPNPFPTMSIFDNVCVGLKLNGVRKKTELTNIAEQALRQAALWEEVKDSLDKSGTSLSGGQQQRLCIARALAVNPEVILMDEPASALDPLSTAKIEELIYELKKQYTIVIVTHNMQQAARVSDFTAFFYMGELIEFDETKTLFTTPQKKQTEDYITGRFG